MQVTLKGSMVIYTGRIAVVMGANGSGKSRFIQNVLNQLSYTNKRLVYVEGGRTISIMPELTLNNGNLARHETESKAKHSFESRLKSPLNERVFDAFMYLKTIGIKNKIAHSDAVEIWRKSNHQNDVPLLDSDPLEDVFTEFNSILPELRLSLNDQKIVVTKGKTSYTASELSDGEKQVLALLVDTRAHQTQKCTFLVDEPELNLHPELATRLWDSIERMNPQSEFLYASHSLSFAMRPSVEKIFVMDGEDSLTEIDSAENIDDRQLRSFLGNIPAILSKSKVIATEGDDDSFDTRFYNWILEDPDLYFLPVGSCSDVISVAKREGVWKKLASGLEVYGIRDRDYTEAVFPETNLFTLPYHEAESFLCHPELLYKLCDRVGARTVELHALWEELLDFAEKTKIRTISKQFDHRASFRLCASASKSQLSKIKDFQVLLSLLKQGAREELERANDLLNDVAIESRLVELHTTMLKACETKNIDQLLQLLPGKQLLDTLAKKIGMRNSSEIIGCASKHIKVCEFPHLQKLRDGLVKLLA